jgi:hypothetical protein
MRLDADTSEVTPSLNIAAGARHLVSLGCMCGFLVSAGVLESDFCCETNNCED